MRGETVVRPRLTFIGVTVFANTAPRPWDKALAAFTGLIGSGTGGGVVVSLLVAEVLEDKVRTGVMMVGGRGLELGVLKERFRGWWVWK